MSHDKLIPAAIIFPILAAAFGNLSKIIHDLSLAQAHVIQDESASNWGTPWMVPEFPRPRSRRGTPHHSRQWLHLLRS
jgi:hypothetical protein